MALVRFGGQRLGSWQVAGSMPALGSMNYSLFDFPAALSLPLAHWRPGCYRFSLTV